MLRRVWAQTTATSTWKPKVEEYVWRDGTVDYSFKDSHGRSFNLKNLREAQDIIRQYKMTEVTDEMYQAGWINPDVYKEVISQRNAE